MLHTCMLYTCVFMSVFILSACSTVNMSQTTPNVRIVDATPASCETRGEFDAIARGDDMLNDRDRFQSRMELEMLARIKAAELGADTVQPITPAAGGVQRFAAWRCAP